MKMRDTTKQRFLRAAGLTAVILILTFASGSIRADSGICGGQGYTLPFLDVAASPFFCQIAEAYFSGLTNGTDATHYSPSLDVTRDQMAAFITRTQDSALRRGNRRAALEQWWTPQPLISLPSTTVGVQPYSVKSDGADLWVANYQSNTVSRVRASDGKLLDTWTGAIYAIGVLVARGRIYVLKVNGPHGGLYELDPTQPGGPVSTVTSSLGGFPFEMAFDGSRVWTANEDGSFSIVSFGLLGVSVNTFTNAIAAPFAIIFDGTNMWATDLLAGSERINKLDPTDGRVLRSVPVGLSPKFPAFDGTNIWVPNHDANSITVVKVSTGSVLATLTANGLNQPYAAPFDGQRILVTNENGISVSLWRATDLTPIGSFSTGVIDQPQAVCSDGLNFWITFPNVSNQSNPGRLARF